MFAEPLSILIARQISGSEATSALPNAPVQDDSRIGGASYRTRERIAASLRAIASQVEPRVARRATNAA